MGRAALALALVLSSACASYRAAPLPPDGQLAPYNARRLDDPGLRAWFDTVAVPYPVGPWSPRALALAADWFRADRAVREARVREAEAALLTAGARPQPGLAGDLEYAFSGPQADSRWGLALAGLFTVELGGKRGARIGRAWAAVLQARAEAVEDAWQQASGVYQAALQLSLQARRLDAVRAERLLQDSMVALARDRFRAGALTRIDLARIEGEARAAFAAEQNAVREEAAARTGLGIAVGLPGPSSAALAVAEPRWPGCTELSGSGREELQRTALADRWSLRRAVAAYQVAEGDLRLEIANASPDLTLGPGLFFDQGTGKFTLGLGLPALGLHRNRGPIAEAEARRHLAGTQLLQAQESILGEVDAALSACEQARGELPVTDSLVAEASRRRALMEEAWNRGETGRLELLGARLDLARAQRLSVEATIHAQETALALERSVGAWGLRSDGSWPTKRDQ